MKVMIGRSTLLDPEKKAVYDSQLPSQKAISSVSQPPALSETASPSQPVSTRAKWTTASNKPTQPDLFRTEPTEPTHDQSSSADSRSGPAMPMPEHLINRPIPQLPPSSKLPSKTNTTVDSQTSNNVPADNIVTTSAGSGVNITSTRRTYLKPRGKKCHGANRYVFCSNLATNYLLYDFPAIVPKLS